jgi:hypothetical protein
MLCPLSYGRVLATSYDSARRSRRCGQKIPGLGDDAGCRWLAVRRSLSRVAQLAGRANIGATAAGKACHRFRAVPSPSPSVPARNQDVELLVDAGESGVDAVESGVDAGESSVDAVESGVDAGESGVDAVESGVDAGESGVDAGESGVDAGESGVDAVESGVDAGESGVDAGESGVDAGESDVDAVESRVDAGKPGVDFPEPLVDSGKAGINRGNCRPDVALEPLQALLDAGNTGAQALLDAVNPGFEPVFESGQFRQPGGSCFDEVRLEVRFHRVDPLFESDHPLVRCFGHDVSPCVARARRR